MPTLLCDVVSPDAKSHALSRAERRKLKDQARADALQPLQQKLQSQDPNEQFEAIEELLRQFENISLDTVLAADVLPWVLQLSQESTKLDLQTQALWALHRFSEGTPKQTKCMVEQGALQRLTPLLTAPSRTQQQVLQIITNVAKASEELRDEVIHAGIVDYVTGQFQGSEPLPVLQKAAGLLRAVCSWPCAEMAEALSKRLLSALSLLLTSNDEDVLINVCEALAMLPHCDPQHLAVLLMRGAVERLVFLLECPMVQAPVCRALQRVACASKTGMQALLVCEPLSALKELMESDEPTVQLESTVLVANTIVFGGPHVQEVLKAGCVPLLLARLDGEAEIRRAAAKGICALMKRAPHAELWKVTTVCGVLEALPGESIALDFLIAALKLTDGELSQTLQEAACAFLEDCHFQDARQEQVQEMLLVLKAPHLRI